MAYTFKLIANPAPASTDGAFIASLLSDAAGDLYGVQNSGGASGFGTIYELVNSGTAANPSYTTGLTTLSSFGSAAGSAQYPSGTVYRDAKGDLFGVSANGGANGVGAFYELINQGTAANPSYAATPTTLFSFNQNVTGGYPLQGDLTADANGDLFGTLAETGPQGQGTVFEFKNTGSVAAPSYTTPIIYALPAGAVVSQNNQDIDAPVTIDGAGDVLGATFFGGANGYGGVYEIANGPNGLASSPTFLVSFSNNGGPSIGTGQVHLDSAGDIIGGSLGGANSDGAIYEIVNNGSVAAPSYASSIQTLATLTAATGIDPTGGLVADAAGNLYGVTNSGGANNDGTVFELAKTSTGYASTPTVLVSFTGTSGTAPGATPTNQTLAIDASGDLYGVTGSGGSAGGGTVFELVSNTPAPATITAITATPSAPGPLTTGQTVTFVLTPSQAVTVTGSPVLTLSDGATASYTAAASSPTSLSFTYTVAAGQNTADLLVSSLTLNGATIAVPGSLAFAPIASYAAGANPVSVTAADLNGDGKLDLVVGNSSGNTVSVLLGNTSGGFGAATTYAAGTAPLSVAATDVNGDGKPDLVVADFTGTIEVLLNNGSGGFGTATSYAAGSNLSALTAADLNGDGKPDLVVTNANTNTVSVLLNNGSGGYGAATTFAAGSYPDGVTTADVNGDGKLDLVVADLHGGVSVLLGNGQGGFGAPTSYAAGTSPESVTTADLNGDGKPDLVVADANGTIEVLLNNGSGGFGTATAYAAVASAVSVTTADVNGDGKLDIIVSSQMGSTVAVLLGNGSGGFAPAVSFAAGSQPYYVTTADVNGDGKPDLVVDDYATGTVSVLQNQSTPPNTFNATSAATAPGANTGLVVNTMPTAITSDTASPATGTETTGQVITFTLAANRAVTVTGTPTLTLNDGGMATYVSGSGSSALVFRTTVAAGQAAQPLQVTGVVLPNGATIQDSTGANATLSGATATFTGLVVDGTPPVVTAGGSATFTAGGSPVVADPALTITDTFTTTLASATVSIGNGFQSGDTLGFTNQSGISGSYNATSGVLTLTGTATTAQYQAALDSVTFATSSLYDVVRTLGYVVNDGTASSAPVTSTVNELTVFTVTNTNTSGAGSLAQAIDSANMALGGKIVFASSLAGQTITGFLPPITGTLSIDGSGAPGLVIGNGFAQTTGIPSAVSAAVNVQSGVVTIANLQIDNSGSFGGNGGNVPSQYGGGGGGGGGLGGGLYVGASAHVTLDGVGFTGDTATGGAGGSPTGGSNTAPINGGFGAGLGGSGGGQGQDGTAGGFGGGGGGGGASGDGGSITGGNGGSGGSGGFGAGAGSPSFVNAYGGGGGGGLGAGGAIFVAQGGTLAFGAGAASLSGNAVVGGQGGTGYFQAQAGQGLGGDLFVQGSGTVTLSPGAGNTLSFADTIDDQAGSGSTGALGLAIASGTVLLGNAGNDFTGGVSVASGAVLALGATAQGRGAITGAGSVRTSGSVTLANTADSFSGGATIASGQLGVNAAGAAGSGSITFGAGTTLALANAALTGGAFANTLTGFASGDTVDLTGISGATGATYTAGTITIQNGATTVATLQATALPAGAQVSVASDGGTGTNVTIAAAPTANAGITNVTFTGGGAPVAADPALTLNTPSTTTLAGATVSIGAGFLAGDTLGFANQNGITGSYNALAGTLSLSGTATTAQYQAALDSVTFGFTPTNGNPTAGNDTSRTLSYTVTDGTLSSTAVTSTLNVVHAPPSVSAGSAVSNVPGGTAVATDASGTVVAPDSGGMIASATVSITAGLDPHDTLGFANQNGITGSYSASTGVLTLSGAATAAQYQSAIDSVMFSTTTAAAQGIRTLSYAVNDGTASSAVATSTVAVATIITAVTATPSTTGPLTTGNTVTFALTPSAPVSVTGSPVLTLNDGATATYNAAASTAAKLSFTYTVAAGQNTSDLQVSSLTLNGGTIAVPAATGFAPATSYAAGPYPESVAVADLNGDGKPDLVVANNGGVDVLLANGSGGFGPATNYTAGANTNSVAVADVNGDGKLDLVVGNNGGGVDVLLGNGSGAFAPATSYAAGSTPNSVAVADVNGDGKADLVVAFEGSGFPTVTGGGVDVLLGNGSGGFGPATSYAAGSVPDFVTVADVNGDGKPDLVVANSGGGVDVLLNNGSGGFGAATSYTTGSGAETVAVADVNGDGKPDLIVADDYGGVYVRLNTGGGTFGAAKLYSAGAEPTSVAVADVNGDGKPDLVVANGNGTVDVLLNNGSGGFGTATGYAAGSTPFSVAVADVNGDGKPDLVVADEGGGTVSVLLNTSTPAGTFSAGSAASAPGDNTGLVVETTPPTVNLGNPNVIFTGGGSPVPVQPTLTLTNTASTTLSGAVVGIGSGFLPGDTLGFANQNGITGSYNASTGTLSLNGTATTAQYQAALDSVTFGFTPTTGNPTSGNDTSRILSTTVTDGTLSGSAAYTINVKHTAPSVTAGASVTAANGMPVATDPSATVTAPDSNGQIASATVTITAGSDPSDVLAFTAPSGSAITGSYSAGVLSLTGTATAAQYQAALDSVTFSTSTTGMSQRTLSLVVNDGTLASAAATSTVMVKGSLLVSNTNASGAGSLAAAITAANAAPGSSIVFASSLAGQTITGTLPAITASVTINGSGAAGLVISGGTGEAFNVQGGTVTLANLQIDNSTLTGPAGGNAPTGEGGGGGGGAGLGGALYVGAAASVTLDGVNLIDDAATGGAGGSTPGNTNSGNPAGGAGGGTGGAGGALGQTGVAGGFGGGGGGNGLQVNSASGGFGGGAAAAQTSYAGGGGGGLGAGGAIFVAAGGTLAFGAGNAALSGNTATGGAGGSSFYNGPASAGLGLGGDLFVQGSGTVTLSPGAGNTLSFADTIADQAGSGSTGSLGLAIASGTVLLSNAANDFTGGVTIASGAVLALSANAQGSGAITGAAGAVFTSGNVTLSNAADSFGGALIQSGTLTVTAAGAAGAGSVTFGGSTTLALANAALTGGAFAPTLVSFTTGDTVDLTGLTGATSATFTNGTITVLDGATTLATLQTRGAYVPAGMEFGVVSDGSSGTDVKLLAGPTANAGSPSVTFTGGGSPVVADPALTLSTTASTTLSGATVSIAAGFLAGDTLGFANQNGITGSYNASTGALALSGTATAAQYQAALDSVTFGFVPAGADPTAGGTDTSRGLSYTVTDGTLSSTPVTSTVTVAPPPSATITAITATPSASGPLGVGQTVMFTLTASQAVAVTGSPVLTLNDGATATYNAASSTPTQLKFTYTVAAGQSTPDLQVSALTLNGGTIVIPGTFGLSPVTSDPAGSRPESVTAADVNGDGKPDLIVADYYGGVSVLLNNGGGGFGAATNYATGAGPYSVTTADVNGDGKPDLIVAAINDNDVSVLLNDGSGGFEPAANYAAGMEPQSVTTADVNGDGKPDLIVADDGGGVDVLLNNGTGGFGPATSYDAGSAPVSVTTADVNGDGSPDLIVANFGGGISVLLNNGSGGFSPATNYAAGSGPDSVTTADVNGDGKPDLVVADMYGGVDVLLNNGAGGFGPAASYAAGSYPSAVTTADVNGDGKPDLVVANDGGVAVLLNNGSGGFGPAISSATGPYPISVTTADVNGDGKPDVVVADNSSGNVSVLLNQSTAPGTFKAASAATAPGQNTGLVVDAAPPVVTPGSPSVTFTGGAAPVAVDPALTVNEAFSATLSGATVSIGAGFLSGDTLGFANQNGITGSYNATTGALALSGTATTAQYQAALDSVTFGFTPTRADPTAGGTDTSRTLSYTVTDGTLASTPVTSTLSVAPVPPVPSDFNGDGKSDLVLHNDNGALAIDTSNGLGAATMVAIGNPGPSWHVVGTGDFNGDGQPDILLQNDDGTVVDYLMNGTTIASGGVLGSPGSAWHVRGVGDFNGDGKSDILLQNDNGSMVDWTVSGSTVTGGTSLGTLPAGWTVEGVADFNGDGHPDILAQNTDGTLVEYTVVNGAITGGGIIGNPGAGWEVAGTGDYNGDGKADILLHYDGGQDVIYEMNGATIIGSTYVGNPGPTYTGAVAGVDINGDGSSDLVVQDNASSTLVGYTFNSAATITAGAVLGTPGAGWNAVGNAPAFLQDGSVAGTQTGTAGADQFNLTTPGTGLHQIASFDTAVDTVALSISQFANYAAVQAAEQPYQGGTFIDFTPNSALVIQGITPSQLTAANFVLR